jgi:hypothetical protein
MPNFASAHYIKLGSKGRWAESSIRDGLLRFGWDIIPLSDMHAEDWTEIRGRIQQEHTHKATATADTARLRDILTAGPNDVWITFHLSRLWWCCLDDSPVEEDDESRFRRVLGGWSDRDAKNRLLITNQLPGKIAALQGYRATVCSVHDAEALQRVIAAETSEAFDALSVARQQLVHATVAAIQHLHWKEFETLVDLIFRQAGWRRRSVLGESMKSVDLELEEAITGDAYQVQVKSQATVADFERYQQEFSEEGFRRLYFVVHSPSAQLAKLTVKSEAVELVLPERLAELTVDHGLVGWLRERVR